MQVPRRTRDMKEPGPSSMFLARILKVMMTISSVLITLHRWVPPVIAVSRLAPLLPPVGAVAVVSTRSLFFPFRLHFLLGTFGQTYLL